MQLAVIKIVNDDVDEESMDDDELVQESICDSCKAELCRSVHKSCYWSRFPQCYGHFITMNKRIKIIGCHSAFKGSCDDFYTAKVIVNVEGI